MVFCLKWNLFNHKSFSRGETFVTKKITMFVAKYNYYNEGVLYLGNFSSKRDWGYANDYIKGIWQILQSSKPDDFVLSTGKSHSVRDFIKQAFKYINVKIIFKGKIKKKLELT